MDEKCESGVNGTDQSVKERTSESLGARVSSMDSSAALRPRPLWLALALAVADPRATAGCGVATAPSFKGKGRGTALIDMPNTSCSSAHMPLTPAGKADDDRWPKGLE